MAEDNDNELWMPAVGFEIAYAVSDKGRVRSLPRISGGKRQYRVKGKVISPSPSHGYLCLRFSVDGKITRHLVHRLVAAAFIGPCPAGCVVNHIDGDPGNNNVANLEYVTPKQNSAHARDVLNSFPRGVDQWAAKLTDEKVQQARVMRRCGMTYQAIADVFGVGRKAIERCCTGRGWSHVA